MEIEEFGLSERKINKLIEGYKELIQESNKNFKIRLEERNQAKAEITQLNSEIEKLRGELTTKEEIIKNLENIPKIQIEEIKERHRQELILKDQQASQQSTKVQELSRIAENFKSFLISEFFDNREGLKQKPLDFLLELFQEKKKFRKQETTQKDSEPKKQTEMQLEEGEDICPFCQENIFNSNSGALQCSECWKKIKSLAVSQKLGLPEARKLFADELGIAYPYENNYEKESEKDM